MGATQTTPPSHHLWAWFQSHTSKQILCTSFYGSLPATWNPEKQSGFFAGCATGFRHAESSVKICSRAVGSDFPQTASVYKSHLFISTTVGTLTEKMFTPCSEMKALQNLPNSKNSTQTFMFSLGLAKKNHTSQTLTINICTYIYNINYKYVPIYIYINITYTHNVLPCLGHPSPPPPRHPGDASPEPLRPHAAGGQRAAGGPHATHLKRLSDFWGENGMTGMVNGCNSYYHYCCYDYHYDYY